MDKIALDNAGVNLDTIDQCFGGNEEIYFRFLCKFFEDKDYIRFNELMEAGIYEEVFNSAHAIKGVAGNLAMTRIYEYLVIIVEKLRNNNYEELDIIYGKFKRECEELQEILLKEEVHMCVEG